MEVNEAMKKYVVLAALFNTLAAQATGKPVSAESLTIHEIKPDISLDQAIRISPGLIFSPERTGLFPRGFRIYFDAGRDIEISEWRGKVLWVSGKALSLGGVYIWRTGDSVESLGPLKELATSQRVLSISPEFKEYYPSERLYMEFERVNLKLVHRDGFLEYFKLTTRSRGDLFP